MQTFGVKIPKSIKNQECNKMTETKKPLIISGLVFNLEKDWLTPIHQSSALKIKDWLTPIHQSSALKNNGLAYAHPSKLRFEN
jgi:hypothetical protein